VALPTLLGLPASAGLPIAGGVLSRVAAAREVTGVPFCVDRGRTAVNSKSGWGQPSRMLQGQPSGAPEPLWGAGCSKCSGGPAGTAAAIRNSRMGQVDEVRAAADIVKIVGDYVKLRKAGVNMKGLCPFHQEKTPSFTVHPPKQIFHCFGCGVGGDVFKFVMLIENLSFPEALRRVAEKAGVRIREGFSDATFDAQAGERTALYKIHELAVKFYAAQLGASAEGRVARAYLADRGLADDVVARFRLGYAPSEGQALTRQLSGAGFDAETLKKSGLVLSDSEGNRLFDRFRRRVIFSIANESGKIVAFGARALGDEQPKYLNSPETPIYTKGRVLYHLDQASGAIRKLDYAVLVEGYMDCIAVASSGVENVVASCGTSLTESQVRLLARSSRRAVVNYDPDSAGVAATERSLSLLLESGFEVRVLALPGGLDPDSFVRQRGAEGYRMALAAAPSYLDYLTERAAATNDLAKPEGKVAAANLVMPYIVRVPNPMLRAELANRLAERLRVDGRLLRQEIERAASEKRREVRLEETGATLKPTPAERDLLRAFLEDQELAEEFLPTLVDQGILEGLAAQGLFKHLREATRREGKVELSRIETELTPEERRLAYECLLGSEETPGRERVIACLTALKRRGVEKEREKLQAEIRDAERQRDSQRLAELLKAKDRLARELAQLGRA
jgi:DNA primase